MSEDINNIDCDDCSLKQDNGKMQLQVAEQVISRIDKLENHFNDGMNKFSEVMNKQVVNEEKLTTMVATMTNVTGQLNTLMSTMHAMQLQMAEKMATKDEVANVYKKLDSVKAVAYAAKGEAESNTDFADTIKKLLWKALPTLAILALVGVAVSFTHFMSDIKVSQTRGVKVEHLHD